MKKIRTVVVALLLWGLVWATAGCSQEKEALDPEPMSVAVEDYAPYFKPHLQKDEFLGYAVEAVYQGETFLYGLVYDNSQGDYVNTPLEALIILQGHGDYQLVKRQKLASDLAGGFEQPIGSGEHYNCQALAVDGNVFIQTREPSFSDFPVLHQILLNAKGYLDFYETDQGSSELIEEQGSYYTLLDGRWRRLAPKDDKINYESVNVADFRPQVEQNSVVLHYRYQDDTPDYPCFYVNDKEAPLVLAEYGGARLQEAIKLTSATKLYIYDTSAFALELQNQVSNNGEYLEDELPVTQKVGYKILDLHDYSGSLSLFLGYYADYIYEIPLEITPE